MPSVGDPDCDPVAAPRYFMTTHWSVILSAKDAPAEQADAALEKLCQTYWRPLYAHVRRRGYEPHDAEDLTQEFFARLLAKDFLRSVDRNKGKFRSFLLAAMGHFLAKEWRRANTQKRGGNCAFVSLDAKSAEEEYLQIPASTLTPDQLYDKQWALLLLGRVLDRLRDEYVAGGKGQLYEETRVFLTGDKNEARYSEIAAKLNTTEAALKMAVSRMRDRYCELRREEIAQTVSGPDEVEEELRVLKSILSS